MINLLWVFGSVMTFVVSDIQGHMDGIRNPRKERTEKGEWSEDITLQAMMLWERDNKVNSVTNHTVYMSRLVKYVRGLYHRLAVTDLPVSEVASQAYEHSLAKHHGWVVRNMVYCLYKFAGTREWCANLMGSKEPKEDATFLDEQLSQIDDEFDEFFKTSGIDNQI